MLRQLLQLMEVTTIYHIFWGSPKKYHIMKIFEWNEDDNVSPTKQFQLPHGMKSTIQNIVAQIHQVRKSGGVRRTPAVVSGVHGYIITH